MLGRMVINPDIEEGDVGVLELEPLLSTGKGTVGAWGSRLALMHRAVGECLKDGEDQGLLDAILSAVSQ